jgi:hypothetical protein
MLNDAPAGRGLDSTSFEFGWIESGKFFLIV